MLRCSTGTGALLPERCHRTGGTGPGTSLHVITDQRTRRAVGGKPGITNIPPLPAVPPVTVGPYGRRLPTPPLSSLDLPREKKGVTVSPVQTVESVPSGVVRPAIRGVGRSVGIMWTTSTGCGWIPAPLIHPQVIHRSGGVAQQVSTSCPPWIPSRPGFKDCVEDHQITSLKLHSCGQHLWTTSRPARGRRDGKKGGTPARGASLSGRRAVSYARPRVFTIRVSSWI